MSDRHQLRVVDPDQRRAPPKRGNLLDCHEVAEMIGRSADWVRRNVPGKIALGHSTKRWYEDDVWRWIESRKE